MNDNTGSSVQPMMPEELLLLEKLSRTSRSAIRITSIISAVLSAIVIAGVVIPSYHMIVIAGVPLFFLLLLTAALTVNILNYRGDIASNMKSVIHGMIGKKHTFARSTIQSYFIDVHRKNYSVTQEFYDVSSEQDMVEIHLAGHSKVVFSIRNVSRKMTVTQYDKII
ncbi:MAG: hypothetical protein HPY53_06250 [Brevinematales bacterium]|nr:hypothetical protein [Brevinematales bacterium]